MLFGNICGMVNDANWHRLDAIWGWVGLRVSPELAFQAKLGAAPAGI
jgi:hypothetical protein